MLAQTALKIHDASSIGSRVRGRGQQLEPDSVELQSPQPEHPLQRHGKIPAAFAIFCCETATDKNCHRSRIARTRRCSSAGSNPGAEI
jgi:hypothetical protein